MIYDRDFLRFIHQIEEAFVKNSFASMSMSEVNGFQHTFLQLNDAGRGLLAKIDTIDIVVPKVLPHYNMTIEISTEFVDGATTSDPGHGDGPARVDQAVSPGGDPGSV